MNLKLFIFLLPVFLLSVSAWSEPASTPSPSPTPAPLTGDTLKAVATKILSAYYSYPAQGLHQFKCGFLDLREKTFKNLLEASSVEEVISSEKFKKNYQENIEKSKQENDRELREKEKQLERFEQDHPAADAKSLKEITEQDYELALLRNKARDQDEDLEQQSKNMAVFAENYQELKPLTSLEFFIEYQENKGFQFTYTGVKEDGGKEYKRVLQNLLTLMRKGVLSPLRMINVFSGFSWEGTDQEKVAPLIYRTKEGYTIEFKKDDSTGELHMTDQFLLTDGKIRMGGETPETWNIQFQFERTDEGYLIRSMDVQTEKSKLKAWVKFEYFQSGTLYLPEKVLWDSVVDDPSVVDKKFSDALRCLDYEVKFSSASGSTSHPVTIESPPLDPTFGVPNSLNSLNVFFKTIAESGFEFDADSGLEIPLGPQLRKNYWGVPLEFGFGYQYDPNTTFALQFDGGEFMPNDKTVTHNRFAEYFNVALTAKYRFVQGCLRPYVFGGPGLALSDNAYGDNNPPALTTDVGFSAEIGAGVEINLVKYLYLSVQSVVIYEFNSASYTNSIGVDNPAGFVPIELGIVFGK